ncbi:hypothetical protein TYRP_002799 [Tyrophagus putrescentiae]|nr:hypothetical protein TYRP_002799 [Tyrophagus putrescentiae]
MEEGCTGGYWSNVQQQQKLIFEDHHQAECLQLFSVRFPVVVVEVVRCSKDPAGGDGGGEGLQLQVAVDVDAVVLAGEHHRVVVHEGDVEALRVLHLRLQRIHQRPLLREDGNVEVVVVVRHQDLPVVVDAHADGVVGQALAADVPQKDAPVAEDLDAVGAIVADEDLLLVIDHHAVGELQVLAAAELVEDVARQVEDDDAHHLALDDDDVALVVDGDAARVLQNVGAELPHELPVLVVHLNLVRGRALGDDNVARLLDHGHAVRVEQLAVTLAALAKLKLEAAVLVEDLNAVVVRVGDDDVVLGVDGHAGGLGELALHDAELAELAVVDHLLALHLRLDGHHRAAGVADVREGVRETGGAGGVAEAAANVTVGVEMGAAVEIEHRVGGEAVEAIRADCVRPVREEGRVGRGVGVAATVLVLVVVVVMVATSSSSSSEAMAIDHAIAALRPLVVAAAKEIQRLGDRRVERAENLLDLVEVLLDLRGEDGEGDDAGVVDVVQLLHQVVAALLHGGLQRLVGAADVALRLAVLRLQAAGQLLEVLLLHQQAAAALVEDPTEVAHVGEGLGLGGLGRTAAVAAVATTTTTTASSTAEAID